MSNRLMAAVLLGLVFGLAHAREPIPWEQLGEAEQQVLSPYAERWESFSPEQQQRLQKGAHRWQQMNGEERAAVRQRFERWQQMPVEQKQRIRERFQAYQSLPPTQQQRIHKQMEAFNNMPEAQREELLQRWQSMSVEEREAIRDQLRAEAGKAQPQPQPSQVPEDAAATGQEPGTSREQPSDGEEAATLPDQEGRFRDNHMERRPVETPTRRPR